MPKVGIKLTYVVPESLEFPHAILNLIPCFLTFWSTEVDPYSLFKFLIFYYSSWIFLHISIMIFQAPSRCQKCYRHLIIILVYRRLLTKRLHGKAAELQQITLKKHRNLFVQGYNHNLSVHKHVRLCNNI